MRWRRLGPFGLVVAGTAATLRDARVRLLLGLTGTLILLASLVYRWLEGWSWLDALFFSVVTISTVGYGDLVPQTAAGKIFTILYIFSGIGLFVAAAGAMAETLIQRARRSADGKRSEGQGRDGPEG